MMTEQPTPTTVPAAAGPPAQASGIATLQPDHWLLGLVLLAALAAVICLFGLGGGPPLGDHECIHAQCARQARQTGDWLIPYFNDIPRVNKPPLGTWLIMLSSLIVDPPGLDPPVSTFAARLPQAMAGVLHVLVICWLGTLMFGRRAGLVAGFIAVASLTTIYFSHSALIEMTLMLFTTLSYACFWRATSGEGIDWRWMALFYLAFALAMLSKAPLPLAVVGVPLAIYWLLARPALRPLSSAESAPEHAAAGALARWLYGVWAQVKAIPKLWFLPGMVLFLVIAAPWVLYVGFTIDGAWGLWRTEFLDRFSGQMDAKVQPWWYYLPIMFGLAVPFLLSLPEAVASPFLPRFRRHRHALVYLLIWGLFGLLVCSASSYKRPHYLAAVMPAFLLMIAPVIDRLFFGTHQRPRRAVTMTCYALLAVIAVGLIAGGVYIAMQMRELGQLYLVTAVGLLVLWGGACLAFRFERRLSSFALLNLGALVMIAAGWNASAHVLRTDAQAQALARAFHDLEVRPDDRIIWVDSRVDGTTAFYGHLRIERLFTPLEMSQLRQGRKRLPPEVIIEAAERMERMLRSGTTTYFILDAGRYETFRNNFDLPAREVFRISGFQADPDKDLVVLGPTADAASPPTTAPAPGEATPTSAPSSPGS